MADPFRLQFGPDGGTSVKVFKLAARDFAPDESVTLRKTISLADLTTRRHYPGEHRVELQLNGIASPLASFMVLPLSSS